MSNKERAWAEISKSVLFDNYQIVKNQIAPGKKIMAILKADGYGHDGPESAVLFEQWGIDYLGVATFREAMQVRARGAKAPLLVFSRIPVEEVQTAIANQITVAGLSMEYLSAIEDQLSEAGSEERLQVHIKIDTGLNRSGLLCREDTIEDVMRDIHTILAMPHIRVTGIYSHFACPNHESEFNEAFTKTQFARFQALLTRLEEEGLDLGVRHICGSLAAVYYPDMQLDMIRAGVILFGITGKGFDLRQYPLRQAMTLKARIIHLRQLREGEYISYGCLYRAEKDMPVALLSIGYADGYRGTLTNRSYVLLKGKKCPVIGKICMDYTMIDLTSVPDAQIGDEAVLMGYDHAAFIPASYLADLTGEIEAEIICNINKRVPRIYEDQ